MFCNKRRIAPAPLLSGQGELHVRTSSVKNLIRRRKIFQPRDARYYQNNTQQTAHGGGFAQKTDAQQGGSDRADARPDGVGRAHGQRFQGHGQKQKAEAHQYQSRHRRPQFRKTLSIFQTNSPAHFKQTCHDKQYPSHKKNLTSLRGRPQ